LLEGNPMAELLLVDDHSSDGGMEWLGSLVRPERMRVLSSSLAGKSAATDHGVKESRHDLLAFTDADCVPHPSWPNGASGSFRSSKVRMVLAPVVYSREEARFNGLFTLDFLSLMAATEAAVRMGRPVMANGANMLIRKEDYLSLVTQLDPADRRVGEDVFLLHALSAHWGRGSVVFDDRPEARVYTSAPGNIRQFFFQMVRWGGIAKRYKDPAAAGLSLLVFLSNFSLIFSLFAFPLGWFLWPAKVATDGLLLRKVAIKYERRDAYRWFLPQSVVYPFYTVLIGALSLVLSPHWKRRAV
jgi:biofilm PGA synthesis N-glycosyltransferase PgaC